VNTPTLLPNTQYSLSLFLSLYLSLSLSLLTFLTTNLRYAQERVSHFESERSRDAQIPSTRTDQTELVGSKCAIERRDNMYIYISSEQNAIGRAAGVCRTMGPIHRLHEERIRNLLFFHHYTRLCSAQRRLV
jgi:hypothetical protein